MAIIKTFTNEEYNIFYQIQRQYLKEDALTYFAAKACGILDVLDLDFADDTKEEAFVDGVLSSLADAYYDAESMEWSANDIWDEVIADWKDSNEADYNHMVKLLSK